MGEAGFLRDVGERTIAIVVIKRIVINAADEHILVAVIVEIADGNARIKAGPFDSSLLSYVTKVPSPLL